MAASISRHGFQRIDTLAGSTTEILEGHVPKVLWCDWGNSECKGPTAGFLYERRTEIYHMFLVFPLPTEAEGLIGLDFLGRTGAKINSERGRMALAATREAPVVITGSQVKRATLTYSLSFSSNAAHDPQVRRR